jgi:hypothetical protein
MCDNSNSVDSAEKAMASSLERQHTAGGHIDDRSQPALPVVHRTFANPAPLGLLSFATGIFLISMFGVHARDLTTPNVLIGVLMFFGGVCQFIAGIMEFVAGNTVCTHNQSSLCGTSTDEISIVRGHCLPSLCGIQLFVCHDLYPWYWHSCCIH